MENQSVAVETVLLSQTLERLAKLRRRRGVNWPRCGLAITESSKDEDQLLIEQIDLDDCIVPKQFHDVSGYYNRYDVFGLTVRRRDQAPAQFDDIGGGGRAVPFAALEADALEDEAAAG